MKMIKQKKYQHIYSSAKQESLLRTLLNKQQIEQLLGSKDENELKHALFDTFLGVYIAEEEDINTAINKCLIDKKRDIILSLPRKDLLDILWLRYDFLNIKAIIKGFKLGFSKDLILKECFLMGTIDPSILLNYTLEETVVLDSAFKRAIDGAKKQNTIYEIDFIITKHYFDSIKTKADEIGMQIIKDFVALLIDLYNLRASIRYISLKKINIKIEYIQGGTININTLSKKEDILNNFNKLGGNKFWNTAITEYENTGNFTGLEVKANRYMVKFLKERGLDLFSPVKSYQYFLSLRNDLQTIRTIYVSKKGGVPVEEIRYMLKR